MTGLGLVLASLALAGCASSERATTAVDAERAFAADAQKLGQWTAFRKWAAPQALMFTPQPVNAHDFLKPLKDPSTSVQWWPGESYVSCDKSFAVNTGPWVRDGGKTVGYFTTVWRRDGNQWRWIYDAGDVLQTPRPRPDQPTVQRASCEGDAPPLPVPMPAPGFKSGQGGSLDNSLQWMWSVSGNGERRFTARLWNGRNFADVISNQVAAPPR
jgi:hypothetical protein